MYYLHIYGKKYYQYFGATRFQMATDNFRHVFDSNSSDELRVFMDCNGLKFDGILSMDIYLNDRRPSAEVDKYVVKSIVRVKQVDEKSDTD